MTLTQKGSRQCRHLLRVPKPLLSQHGRRPSLRADPPCMEDGGWERPRGARGAQEGRRQAGALSTLPGGMVTTALSRASGALGWGGTGHLAVPEARPSWATKWLQGRDWGPHHPRATCHSPKSTGPTTTPHRRSVRLPPLPLPPSAGLQALHSQSQQPWLPGVLLLGPEDLGVGVAEGWQSPRPVRAKHRGPEAFPLSGPGAPFPHQLE